MVSSRRPAPNDAPSTLKDPDYAKRKRREEAELQARYAAECGPVTVRSDPSRVRGPVDDDEAQTPHRGGPA